MELPLENNWEVCLYCGEEFDIEESFLGDFCSEKCCSIWYDEIINDYGERK